MIGDKKPENAQAITETMNNAGFDAVAMEMDLMWKVVHEFSDQEYLAY